MVGLGVITIFCLLLGLYGYFLSHHLPSKFYSATNLTVALLTVLTTRLIGVSWSDLGIGSLNFTNALIMFVFFGLVLVFGSSLVSIGHLKLDKQYQKELLFRIPYGTTLAEEVIFRGSLLGLAIHYYSNGTALLITSLIFGLWHLL